MHSRGSEKNRRVILGNQRSGRDDGVFLFPKEIKKLFP